MKSVMTVVSLFCRDDCTLSSCGDGFTNLTAGEECDDVIRITRPVLMTSHALSAVSFV